MVPKQRPMSAAQTLFRRGVDPNKQRTANRILGDYTLSKILGVGTMGKVKLAHHNITGEKVRTHTISFLLSSLLPCAYFPFVYHTRPFFQYSSLRSLPLSLNRHHDHHPSLRVNSLIGAVHLSQTA
ncbi:hypothetical protein BC826DRAFT_996262 [Russula brevipes]|nr:hypothetical protein BC826DRAFT_996262 [Russula brevipes]